MHERWRYRHVVPPSQPLVLLALVVVLVACVVSSVGAQGNSPAVFALRENPNAAAASTQQYSALLEEQQRADDAAPLSFEEEELASQPEYTRLRSLRERVVQVMEELQSATSEYQSSLSRATTLAHAISRHVIEPAFRSLASDAARPDGSVVILVVNSGFLEVALNCICSMRMVASDPTRDRFLVVATDRSTFNILRAMRVPTYFFQSGVAGTSFPFDSPLSTAYQRFGSYDLQRLVHARMQVSLWLLQLGYSVLVCDADLVWLRDPFPLIHLANATTPHKILSINDARKPGESRNIVGTGFMWLPPTVHVVQFWGSVLVEHFHMLAELAATRTPTLAQTERSIINEWYHRRKPLKEPSVALNASNSEEYYRQVYHWGADEIEYYSTNNVPASGGAAQSLIEMLPASGFINGRVYFESNDLQYRGIVPAVVHCNHVIGLVNKRDRFQHSGMWLLRQHDAQCPISPLFVPKVPPAELALHQQQQTLLAAGDRALDASFKLRIVVLASAKHTLLRCLNSLRDASYHPLDLNPNAPFHRAAWGSKRPLISLDVHVNSLASSSDSIEPILLALDQFTWPHGEKRVHFRSGAHDSQFVESWYPPAVLDAFDEYALIISDHVQVAPAYYLWLRRVAGNYFLNQTNADQNLFGISLQHQILDPAHYPTPFLKPIQDVAHVRPSYRNLFRYQLAGASAMVVSPSHWRSFRRWYSIKMLSGPSSRQLAKDAIPFVPLIRTNVQGYLLNQWALTHAKQQLKLSQLQQSQRSITADSGANEPERDSVSWWLPFLTAFLHELNLYVLYPSLPLAKSLSIDHRMPLNQLNMQLISIEDATSMLEPSSLGFMPLHKLPLFNLCAEPVQSLQQDTPELQCTQVASTSNYKRAAASEAAAAPSSASGSESMAGGASVNLGSRREKILDSERHFF